MSVKDIRAKYPIKTIPKIIGEPTYKAINDLREALYVNAAAIPTTIERDGNGHIGRLLTETAVYVNVSTTG